MDVSVVEAAFLRIAERRRSRVGGDLTIQACGSPSSGPTRIPGTPSPTVSFIAFACWTNPKGCGEGSNTWIYVYPSAVEFSDTRKALADITGYFEKNASLKIGEVRRAEITGGEVLWTEQPGSNQPVLAAVRRMDAISSSGSMPGLSVTRTNDSLRGDFLAFAKNVRAGDGK